MLSWIKVYPAFGRNVAEFVNAHSQVLTSMIKNKANLSRSLMEQIVLVTFILSQLSKNDLYSVETHSSEFLSLLPHLFFKFMVRERWLSGVIPVSEQEVLMDKIDVGVENTNMSLFKRESLVFGSLTCRNLLYYFNQGGISILI